MSHPDTEEGRRNRDLVGRRLMSRYVVAEKIARGGMAVVYRGEDERLHRPVCVKLFFGFGPHQQEYAVVLEHFVQEAFALSRLQHPATLRIYDFGYLDEDARTEPFFVTEFADGGHLGHLVADTGGLPPVEVLRLLGPIVSALREAHAAGIVHRDLKPSNILLTSAGGELSPKLADFSIAKARGDLPNRASETNAQAPLYSLSWAAPEQMSGGAIGPAADVFALALLTAYLLTEQLVYPGEDIMALYTLRSEGAPWRERSIRGIGLPPAIEAVVLRATAEDSAARPQSVEAFFDELRSAVADTQAHRARPTEGSSHGPHHDGPHHDGPNRGPDQGRNDGLDDANHDELLPRFGEHDPDDMPTDQHSVLRLEDMGSTPSVTKPIRTPPRRAPPQLLPPVSPSNPTETSAPRKPRLQLATLDATEIVVGHRRVRLRRAGDAPVELPDALGGRPARLRVTPQELGAGQVHLKGLNCFLRNLEGRPSSGLDVDRSRTLELLDPQSGVRAPLRITMGPRADGSHELELGDSIIAVPATLARWVVVLEAGRETLLLYHPPR